MKRPSKVSTYAEVVQLLLDETGWTAYRLAKETGLTAVAVGDILAGKRQPKTETLRLMLKAAGKRWAWLDDVFDPNGDSPPLTSTKADGPLTTYRKAEGSLTNPKRGRPKGKGK